MQVIFIINQIMILVTNIARYMQGFVTTKKRTRMAAKATIIVNIDKRGMILTATGSQNAFI